MSERKESASTGSKVFIGSLVALFGFGLLVAFIVAGGAGESPLERTAAGDFSEETTELRWKNLEEVSSAQQAAVPSDRLAQAIAAVIEEGGASGPQKTDLVVPGSPTFLKQAAAESPAPVSDENEVEGNTPSDPEGDETVATPATPATPAEGASKSKAKKKAKNKGAKGKKKGAAPATPAPANPNPQQ